MTNITTVKTLLNVSRVNYLQRMVIRAQERYIDVLREKQGLPPLRIHGQVKLQKRA